MMLKMQKLGWWGLREMTNIPLGTKKSLSSYVKYVEIEVICNYTKLFVVFTNQKFLAIDTAERF